MRITIAVGDVYPHDAILSILSPCGSSQERLMDISDGPKKDILVEVVSQIVEAKGTFLDVEISPARHPLTVEGAVNITECTVSGEFGNQDTHSVPGIRKLAAYLLAESGGHYEYGIGGAMRTCMWCKSVWVSAPAVGCDQQSLESRLCPNACISHKILKDEVSADVASVGC